MDAGKNSKPLRLLMTTDTVGGVWTYTMDLCRALYINNTEIHLITLGASMQAWQKAEVEALAHVKVYETDIPLEWMDNPWQKIAHSHSYLRSLENTIRPDIVHLNSFAYGSLGWQAPVVTIAHSDVYTWFRSVQKKQPPCAWEVYFNLVKSSLDNSDYIVAPTRAFLTDLTDVYSPTAPVKVIYNSRHATFFSASAKEATMMSIGRVWDKAKNIELLLKAAKDIRGSIRIAGENNFENNMLEVKGDNVDYLGKLDPEKLAAALATTGIYVLPAKYEPFGLSILEAAMSGCALVLGDIPSLREVWGDNALYVAPNDADMLANTLNGLLADEKLMRKYADRALAHARLYSCEKMGKEYISLYKSLAGRNMLNLKN